MFAPLLVAAQGAKAVFATNRFHFGKVIRGVVLHHDFLLKNEGSEPLRVTGVSATQPLAVTSVPESLRAGAEAAIRVSLDTSRLSGPFEGEILVALSDPAFPEERLSFRGEVYPLLEVLRAGELSLTGHPGETKEVSVEIVSHEPQPLRILKVEHPVERFTTRLEALEDGRRYRLSLILNPKGPAGKRTETIRIVTSSKDLPVFGLTAQTELRARVWASPETVTFGPLAIGLIREQPDLIRRIRQTLQICHAGGSDFQVDLRADLPALDLRWERSREGNCYQATIRLVPENLQVGPLQGFVYVETSDPESPRLRVAVTGTILDR